jgi:hypothetical protein
MVVVKKSMNYRFNKAGGGNKNAPKNQPLLSDPNQVNKKQLQNFTGKAGNVKVNPFTGEKIAQGQRVKPKQFLRQQRAAGGAVEEAKDFEFDVPSSGAGAAQGAAMGTAGQIGQTAQNLLGGGGQQISTGGQFAQQGADALQGVLGAGGAQGGLALMNQQEALRQMGQLQNTALDPTINNPMFDANRQARINEAQALESNLMDAFARNRGADVANLAARGVLDSTTAENTMSARDAQLGLALNQLLSQANETSRQEVLGERQRMGDAAQAFGQNQSLQAAQQGGIAGDVLRTQGTAGSNLGNLGLGQQGVGTNLAGLGAGLLGDAGQLQLGAGALGINNINQLAQLQLAELGQRLMGQQTGLGNLESLKNANLNRGMLRENMAYLEELRKQAASGGGFSLGGMGSGAMTGAAIGSVVPGVGTLAGGAIGAGLGGLFG